MASVTPPHPACHTTPASLSRPLDSPKTKVDRYENPSQLDHSSTHRQVTLYEDPTIIKQPSMALQQGHSPARPLDSYKDTSQVALY